jgi:hypothetical protein
MINWEYGAFETGNDLEECDSNLIQVPSPYLLTRADENHREP